MKILHRLLLLMILTTLITISTGMAISSYVFRDALQRTAHDELQAVLQTRFNVVDRYLNRLSRELEVVASSQHTAEHMPQLTESFARLEPSVLRQTPQGQQIANDDNLRGYQQAEQVLRQYLTTHARSYDWDDVYLIDPLGNVIFSLQRDQDFATNLHRGPWQDSGLAQAARPLLQHRLAGSMSFADFAPYQPKQHKKTAFLARSLVDPSNGKWLGVVVLELPLLHVEALLADKTGLGESGVSFLIGADQHLLTQSMFGQTDFIDSKLDSDGVRRVMAGESGIVYERDFDGVEVYEVFRPLQPFAGQVLQHSEQTHWGLLVKINRQEVMAEFYTMQRLILISALVLILLAVIVASWGRARSPGQFYACRMR